MEPWALIPIGVYLLIKIVESLVHHRLLKRVPLRIHVNGTRGKSQTTELITCGLQAVGIKVMGKVTGSVPTLLHTDGRRTEIKRIAPGSIREQQWVISQAAQEGAQVLVLECMAIKPELQRASEQSMVRSQIGIITNVRPDHTDLLGESGEAIAQALTCTIPSEGILFTTEQTHQAILAQEAEKRGTRLVPVSVDNQFDRTVEEEIPEWIHADNLALALAVCEYIGAPRNAALDGMLSVTSVPGSFGVIRLAVNGRSICFANAFSGNDPISTEIMLEKTLSSLGEERPLVGLFNHRKDRFYRAQNFAKFARKAQFDRLFLIGDNLCHSHRLFPDSTDLSAVDRVAPLWERIEREIEDRSIVFGFGNIAGIALELNEYLQRIGEEA
jgi:poly-gamma-glutamate synthase PgsB/CapB